MKGERMNNKFNQIANGVTNRRFVKLSAEKDFQLASKTMMFDDGEDFRTTDQPRLFGTSDFENLKDAWFEIYTEKERNFEWSENPVSFSDLLKKQRNGEAIAIIYYIEGGDEYIDYAPPEIHMMTAEEYILQTS
jgi:hypothetical protein